MLNTMQIRHCIGKALPKLTKLQKERLKARFEQEVLDRHEATVKKYIKEKLN
ncbi:hypothetical protein LCGC14_2645770, partial [marine sediment metagenome]